MARQVNINKDVSISEIRKVKRDLQKFVDLYEKVTFIEEIYCNKWVKDWNEKGFDGLFRKEGSGRNSKLSDLQFKVLRENIISKGLTSVQEVKMEIKNEFGVVYSERHLRRLIFDLGLEDMIISNHIK